MLKTILMLKTIPSLASNFGKIFCAGALSVLILSGFSLLTPKLQTHAATFTVTNTNDEGPGSLAQAIADANNNPGIDIITFNIPGPGPHKIIYRTEIVGGRNNPAITEGLIIDATTQPGYQGRPIVGLIGNYNLNFTQNYLKIASDNVTIRGLLFSGGLPHIATNLAYALSNRPTYNNVVIENNFFGVDFNGNTIENSQIINRGSGYAMTLRVNSSTVRNNVISGFVTPHSGMSWATTHLTGNNNVVENNIFGLNFTGTQPIPNYANHLSIRGNNNRVTGNVLSNAATTRPTSDVDFPLDGSTTMILRGSNNIISNNKFGTDITGKKLFCNYYNNITLVEPENSFNNQIGPNNVFCGKNGGFGIDNRATNTNIFGNSLLLNDIDDNLISFTSPQNKQAFIRGQNVPIVASINSQTFNATSVSFYRGDILIGTDNTPDNGFSLNVNNLPLGSHQIRAVANDGNNNTVNDSTPVTVQIVPAPDNIPDIYWQNNISADYADVAYWFMNSDGSFSGNVKSFPQITNWQVVGIKDINADGTLDFILRHQQRPEIRVWILDQAGNISSDVNLPNIDRNHVFIGSEDFNNDGINDILWQSILTGEVFVWILNSDASFSRRQNLPTNPGTNWRVVNLADFNNDGTPDLFFRTPGEATGVWILNDDLTINQAFSLPEVPLFWKLVVTKDFNNDNIPDILWQNQITGQIGVWIMNRNGTLNSVRVVPTNPQPNWEVVAAVDFNRDNNLDLVFRERGGTPGVWLLNQDLTILEAKALPNPGRSWMIVGVL